MKTQYAEIPIEFIEIIKSSNNKISIKKFNPLFRIKLSKSNPSSKLIMQSIIVKISLDKNPYVEELLTRNKIGLNKNDGYKIYLRGDTVYKLCSKEEAYLKITNQLNYKKEITNLFNS